MRRAESGNQEGIKSHKSLQSPIQLGLKCQISPPKRNPLLYKINGCEKPSQHKSWKSWLQNNNYCLSTEISTGEAAIPIEIQNNGIFARWPEKRTNPKDATKMATRQDSNLSVLLKAKELQKARVKQQQSAAESNMPPRPKLSAIKLWGYKTKAPE